MAPEASARVMSDSEMPPTPDCRMRALTSSVPSFSSELDDGFGRTLHVGANHEREFLAAGSGLQVLHHVDERAAAGAGAGGLTLALLTGAVFGDFASARFRLDDRDAIAGFRRAVEAQNLDRNRGSGLLDVGAAVVDQGANAAPFGARHHDVAGAQGPALDEDGRHRTATAIELRLDDRAFRGAIRIGLEIEDFGLELQTFEERLETVAGLGRDFEFEGVAAHRFDHDRMLQQLGADPLRIGVGLVDLVDGDDQRNVGGLGVRDGLDRLRHDAVIGRHHQHHDIRHLGAAGAHGREGGVAGRIDEGDLAAERRGHLIGADMLRDAAGFARHHVGLADGVEQRGLAVVDVAHDGHDRRTRLQVVVDIAGVRTGLLPRRIRQRASPCGRVLRRSAGRCRNRSRP